MIDFIKIQINNANEIERLWARDELIFHDFKERLSHFDFETLTTKETKKYCGILFCKFETKLEILLRPHYLFNNNQHNANDFGIANCIQLLHSVLIDLEVECSEEYHILNIEFGVNMVIPGYGKNLVQFTEYWKKTLFKYDTDLGFSKKAHLTKPSGRANTYKIVKLYSKGLQHPKFCDKNTIRFEIKSKQQAYLKRLGVTNFNDLLKVEVYQNMKDELLNTSNHLLILDQTTKPLNLNIREANKLVKYLNPHNWYELSITTGNGFWEQKKRFLRLLDSNGFNIHHFFTEKLNEKINSLSNESVDETCMNSTLRKTSFKKRNMYEFDNSICRIPPSFIFPKTNCQVTGISLMNEGPFTNPNQFPKYIRTKSLRHIRKHDLKKYLKLVDEFIPKRAKRPKYEKSEIQHLAKQIRNKYYNAKRKKSNQPVG